MRRGEQIDAARHQGHALQRVVDRDREVIARRHLLAGQHDIAERRRIGRDARSVLVPVRAARCAPAPRRHRAATRNRPRCRAACGAFCGARGGGRCRGRARPARPAARRRRARSRPGSRAACKSRDRAAPSRRADRAPRGNRRNARIAGAPARPNRARARRRSSRIAAAYSARQRVWSMSSRRSRKRPPASRAARQPSSAERTWPRCRYPVGLGANRVTTLSALDASLPAAADDSRAADLGYASP